MRVAQAARRVRYDTLPRCKREERGHNKVLRYPPGDNFPLSRVHQEECEARQYPPQTADAPERRRGQAGSACHRTHYTTWEAARKKAGPLIYCGLSQGGIVVRILYASTLALIVATAAS